MHTISCAGDYFYTKFGINILNDVGGVGRNGTDQSYNVSMNNVTKDFGETKRTKFSMEIFQSQITPSKII